MTATKTKKKSARKSKLKIVTPLANRVLLERMAEKKVSDGGIILPASADARPRAEATVIAAGPDATGVKKGDHVLFNAYGGSEVEVNGKGYLIVGVDEILAVVS